MDEIEIKREEYIKLVRRSAWVDLLIEAYRLEMANIPALCEVINNLTERDV